MYSDRTTDATRETTMRQTYEFKVAPTYTAATCYTGNEAIHMDEWSGRTVEEFAAGMKGRGFSYRVEEYTLSGGRFVEHIWER
jgi:hypothetical protein